MRVILRITLLLGLASAAAALVRAPVASVPAAEPAPAPVVAVIRDASLEPARGKRAWDARRGYRAALPVALRGEPVAMAVTAMTVLPGERVELEVPAGTEVAYGAGELVPLGKTRFEWVAPEAPGIHALAVREAGGGDGEVLLNLLVAYPAEDVSGGALNGYRIGAYRERPLRGDPAYLPPEAFVEVSAGDRDVLVSPHFTLGEFLCKQEGEPRYMALSPALVLKLELILEAVNEAGIPAGGLTVMSGFRTPFYNRAIGNTTDYSRHLWGDAADVFIDEDGDGRMDDLNGDGVRNVADAQVLAQVVERLASSGRPDYPVGGMGSYRPNGAHGGFVHVDARGQRARW